MRIIIATEARFHRDNRGRILTTSTAAAYPMWANYLAVFDEVLLLARVAQEAAGDADSPVEGPGVRVAPLPSYRGAAGSLRRLPALRAAVRRVVTEHASPAAGPSVHHARVPGLIGTLLTTELRLRGIPFGLEVVGDIAEVLADRPAASAVAGRLVAGQCRAAAAVSYVTRHTLQGRYPARPGVPTVSCPGVRLHPEDFVPAPRQPPAGRGAGPAANGPGGRPVRLLTIGSQERMYKGHDVLVAAAARLRDRGVPLALTIVGDGRHHDEIVGAAAAHGLGGTTRFVRALSSRAEIRAAFDEADVFVLPSRTEGLPRVLLEAAARGLPAVASAVGGVVEVLPGEYLVPPGAPEPLADALAGLLASPHRYAAASARNLSTAREYALDRIRPVLHGFHRTLEEVAATPRAADTGGARTPVTGGSGW
ncbi:glycosyltransferase [Frankia sp. EI5c]|uniref:glycosyltransferase n=1 Tax=Frankia sp. EI5c TaxID=683316 RepID=UPI0007C2A7EA|nr:glycosyltransferase [Frankia sp. EI5c]OAA26742.1 glycosyltransferase [Frankia sp. EI5c]